VFNINQVYIKIDLKKISFAFFHTNSIVLDRN